MRKILLFIIFILSAGASFADEGMWLLPYLQKVNEADMKARGMRMSAEDIYSANNSSLKDAVVVFGGFCTGEVVSSEGLLLTNYHCGYGSVQKNSSPDRDLLRYGFWAMSRDQEIPVPGLYATFVRHMEDVTTQIVPMLGDNLSESAREKKVKELIEKIVNEKRQQEGMVESNRFYVSVESIFGGNQYMLFITERYNDIRMVGVPPSSIGMYGGDTDNWMWPRHTGDFALFRIYAGKDGEPAAYSADNVPYKPAKYLNVSVKGVKENDFAMVLGFPGSTDRYMTSYEIEQLVKTNKVMIEVRGIRQEIMAARMEADDAVRIKYASKYTGSSNYWKNAIGKNINIEKKGLIADRAALEDRFSEWAAASLERAKYAVALPLIKKAVDKRESASYISAYLNESFMRGIELISMASVLRNIESQLENKGTVLSARGQRMAESLRARYKDYDEPTDREIAKAMFRNFGKNVDRKLHPDIFKVIHGRFHGDYDKYVDWLFDNSMLADSLRFNDFIKSPSFKELRNDPAYQAHKSITGSMPEPDHAVSDSYKKGRRLFIAGLMDMDSEKMHYPDANFTMRATYGNVLSYKPADAVTYNYYTTLTGVMEKEDPANPVEFTVPDKLKELYISGDYGEYGYGGDLPICFIFNGDITGGNSGSPVINGDGDLIGIAFDGNWEAMSGDMLFDGRMQRCINVDMRYVLFIIDKYAGAKHLIDEMTIVR